MLSHPKPPFRVIFMGTPEFAVPTLELLSRSPDIAQVVHVYTQPDRPAGRGQHVHESAIKQKALELGIPISQPPKLNTPEEKMKIAQLMPDFIIVVAYGQFLGKGVLSLPRLGCLNVHASLLPKYRGAAPLQYALWKGDPETGTTIMRMIEKMDAGPMLAQEKITITPDLSLPGLHDALSNQGAKLLVSTLARIQEEGHLEEKEQDESQVSFAPSLKKEEGKIDWRQTAAQILNQIRALNPWPGTYTHTNRGILKILAAHSLSGWKDGLPQQPAGSVLFERGQLFVHCQDDWIQVSEVQPEGKRKMTSIDFWNGLHEKNLTVKI